MTRLCCQCRFRKKTRVFAINNPAADWTMRDNIVIGGDLRLAIADMSMAAAQQPENVLGGFIFDGCRRIKTRR